MMNSAKNITNTPKGPIIDPGICRCCGSTKKCRLLNVEYEWTGNKEIYSDMLFDCFGLLLSNLDGEPEERLICANCVVRLRDALSFRLQVLRCEELLLKSKIQGSDEIDDDKIKIEVKLETPQSPMLMDNDDDDHYSDDNISSDDVKPEPRTLRSRFKATKLTRNTTSKRRTVAKKTVCVDVELKKEMLLKIRKMRAKLNGLKQADLNNRVPSKDLKEKKEMLLQMREMRAKLAAMRQTGEIERKPSITLVRKKISVDKDNNSFWNAVTIVENSYVCPFVSTYSDYFCVYCKEMFTEPEKLREHTMTHDPGEYREVVNNKKLLQIDILRMDCRICQKRIDDFEELKSHLSSDHNKHFYTEVNEELLKFRLKSGTVACLECDRTFSFFHALKKHMAEHFGTFICDICGAHYFEERLLIQHKKSHKREAEPETERFPCNECGKCFKSKKNRYFHVARIHNNEPAYSCNKCDETFLSHHMRYKHKMEVHGETRTFPCESCDRVYTNRKSLREHNRKNHLQLLRYICNHCDKKFYLPSQLKDHMTSHTGERNFRCEYCGKSYPRLRALKVHMQSHNSEKRYKCSLCTASYTQLNNYKNHLKSKHQNDGQFP